MIGGILFAVLQRAGLVVTVVTVAGPPFSGRISSPLGPAGPAARRAASDSVSATRGPVATDIRRT